VIELDAARSLLEDVRNRVKSLRKSYVEKVEAERQRKKEVKSKRDYEIFDSMPYKLKSEKLYS